MTGKQFGLLRKGEDLLLDTPHQESVIPVREISAPNSAICEQGVPSKKFLKKCHVEHKRIGGMPRDRANFEFESCDPEGWGFGLQDVIDPEVLQFNGESPGLQHINQQQVAAKGCGGVDGDARRIEFWNILDMVKMLMG